jgi:tetratricopeptide (TPR) repeat protein
MLRFVAIVSLFMTMLIANPAHAVDEAAPQASTHMEKAAALLAEADFKGAAAVYAQAAKDEPDNTTYRQHLALIQRVIKLRTQYPAMEAGPKKAQLSIALRSFYHDYDIFTEALKLDEARHAEMNNAESAVLLAETLLEMQRHADAQALLERLPDEQHSARSRALLGIALARGGHLEQASAMITSITLPKKDDPKLFFELACLHGLLDDQKQAAAMLTRSFQTTLPSQLDKARHRAAQRSDLEGLIASDAWAVVMKTESKVAESSCSGGSSCAGCPSRSSCGSGESGDEKK